MRQRWLGLALGLSLFAFVLSRLGGSEPARSAASSSPSAPAPAPAPLATVAPLASPSRNLFEYASEEETATPSTGDVVVAPATPEPSVAREPRVRLVGLLRQGAGLKAILAVSGEVVVVGAGEVALGHTVLSVDEDEGVRLREPGGSVSLLKP